MSYVLTSLGETRAMRVGATLNPESNVLGFMYDTREAVEFEEILDETHMDDATARKLMSRLIVKGYVKET